MRQYNQSIYIMAYDHKVVKSQAEMLKDAKEYSDKELRKRNEDLDSQMDFSWSKRVETKF